MNRDLELPVRLLYAADSTEGDEFYRVLERQPDFSTVEFGHEVTPDHVISADCVVIRHGTGVDGIAVLETIRERYPDLPVVLLGPDDGILASQAIAANVSEFVPFAVEDSPTYLVERVRSAVAAGPRDDSPQLSIEEIGVREKLQLKERAIEEAPVGVTISDAGQPDNPLIYINDAFEKLTGYTKEETIGRNCRFLQGDESDTDAVAAMREAIDREESVSVELVNYRKNGETFWNEVDIAPVRSETSETTNFVGFQTDVTARKEAELELKREQQRLEHLLNRIEGLLQDVHSDLVQAVNREDVESVVCERIAAEDPYGFCWIGVPDLSRDTIVATAQAGAWSPDNAALDIDLTTDSADISPIVETYETECVQIIDDPNDLAAIIENVPSTAMDADFKAVATIPLVYRETLYGVLVVCTTEEDALNEREAIVLEALGRAIATAINALERERIIIADSVVELEFEMRDLFFVDLSDRHSTEVEYNGSIYRTDRSMLMFFTADIDLASVEKSIEHYPDVEDVTLVSAHDGGNLFEFTVGMDSIITTLAERGAKIRSMRATNGIGHVSVELPTEADARAIVTMLKEQYPNTELIRYREQERPPETKQEFIEQLKDTLTERQLTALQTAYVGGFYEWKRPISGDELAETMGIARSTFHQHLRAAEGKLIAELFD